MSFLEGRCGLKGKVAVVAGGGGGLGRAAALDLAAAGMSLALCDIDAAAVSHTAAEADRLGADTIARTLDVRDSTDLADFFELVNRRHRRLDVLVNVVGGTFRSQFVDVNEKGRDTLVRTNFSWVADAIVHAVGLMSHGVQDAQGGRADREVRGGSIITITSIEAHRAAPGFAVYAAMKAAVTHLSRTLAVELGPLGIRVNCVAPDFVPTEGMAVVASSAGSAGVRASAGGEDPGDGLTIPLGRKGRPEDVGNCVLFLASDLSSYVTGTTLHPDGGALAASGWMNWPDDGYTARPPSWVLDRLQAKHSGQAG